MNQTTYLSFLRGINVSGQKIIKMADLKQSFESLKFQNVRTYIQSGNVLFESSLKSTAILATMIQKRILKDFGHEVWVAVRSTKELGKIIRKNPFLKLKGVNLTRIYVSFGSQASKPASLQGLKKFASPSERFHPFGNEIYLYCPDGYGKTKLSNNTLEKVLSIQATTRNWNTVQTLYEMALR